MTTEGALTEKSLEDALVEIEKLKADKGAVISIKPTHIVWTPEELLEDED